MSFSLRLEKVRECQRISGKLAMIRGEWQFRTVGQGKYSILIITEIFNF